MLPPGAPRPRGRVAGSGWAGGGWASGGGGGGGGVRWCSCWVVATRGQVNAPFFIDDGLSYL